MTHDDKEKAAKGLHEPSKSAPAKTAPPAKSAKAVEVPRKDGEVDLAKVKELRREAPGEEPEPPGHDEARPALVHSAPHLPGAPHVAGEDPTVESETDDKGDVKAKAESPDPDNAQILYGLRKEGRLYRCSLPGEVTLLIEADSPEQAKEAYCAEMRRERGEEPAPAKGNLKSQVTSPRPPAPLPPLRGYTVIEPVRPPVPLKAERVRCVKLTA